MLRKIMGLSLLFLLVMITIAGVTSGIKTGSFEVEGDSYDHISLNMDWDIYRIELIDADDTLNLYIMDWEEYNHNYQSYGGVFDADWTQKGVTSGTWEWDAPDTELWMLVVENTHSEDVWYEIDITEPFGGYTCCCVIAAIAPVMLMGLLVLAVRTYKKD